MTNYRFDGVFSEKEFGEIFLSKDLINFQLILESHAEEIYNLTGIDYTPENIEISDKFFEKLIMTFENDWNYKGKTCEKYSDFFRWLKRTAKSN